MTNRFAFMKKLEAAMNAYIEENNVPLALTYSDATKCIVMAAFGKVTLWFAGDDDTCKRGDIRTRQDDQAYNPTLRFRDLYNAMLRKAQELAD